MAIRYRIPPGAREITKQNGHAAVITLPFMTIFSMQKA